MFAEDLTVFFNAAEFALLATWGTYSANVLMSTPTEDVLGSRAIAGTYEAKCRAYDLPGIKRGDSLAVLPAPILDLAQAGGASTITLANNASSVDAAYVGATVTIQAGTGAGSTGTVSAYVGATRQATVSAPWASAPAAGSTYRLQTAAVTYTVGEARLVSDGAIKALSLRL